MKQKKDSVPGFLVVPRPPLDFSRPTFDHPPAFFRLLLFPRSPGEIASSPVYPRGIKFRENRRQFRLDTVYRNSTKFFLFLRLPWKHPRVVTSVFTTASFKGHTSRGSETPRCDETLLIMRGGKGRQRPRSPRFLRAL